jgi:hypothetical protein
MHTAVVVALAVTSLAATGCGGQKPEAVGESRSGELRIVEVHVPGAPFPIEGELSYVRVAGDDGALAAEHRLDLDGTEHTRLALPDRVGPRY